MFSEPEHLFSGSSGDEEGCNAYILVFLLRGLVLVALAIILLFVLRRCSHLILLC